MSAPHSVNHRWRCGFPVKPSLPGLTRQSIFLRERSSLRRLMDARVKPGHDAWVCVAFVRGHGLAISPQVCTSCSRIFRLLKIRGRGECRVPNAPAASCALGSWSMHTSIHSGGTGNIRHSPRNGFTAYIVLSLGTGPSCPHRPRDDLATLASASGGQDHTPSPSA